MSIAAKNGAFKGSKRERREYWLRQLTPLVANPEFPLAGRRPATLSAARQEFQFSAEEQVWQKLAQITGDSRLLTFAALLGALQICLFRYTGEPRIVVGSPVRRPAGDVPVEPNVIPIVASLDAAMSFKQVLLSAREAVIEGYARSAYPYQRMLADLKLEPLPNRYPLFDFVLGMEDFHAELPVINNDVTLLMSASAAGLKGRVFYSAELFEREDLERFTRHLVNVIEAGLTNPDRRIAELPLLSAGESRRLLTDFNDTACPYPSVGLHDLFASQAARTPEALAVTFNDEPLTYRELNERSNQLAHYLRRLGARPEVRIGLCLERGLNLMIALLGVLKAGGAYVPLDPGLPAERLSFLLADADVSILITESEFQQGLPTPGPRLVHLDAEREQIEKENVKNPDLRSEPGQLAYLMYTSGSTGEPKGVLIEHRGLVNLAEALRREFQLSELDHCWQSVSISFDGSVFQILMSLLAGATLHIANQEERLPGLAMIDFFKRHEITAAGMPPSVLAAVGQPALPKLKTILVAAEPCPAELVARWSSGRRFYNTYGPTEASISATMTSPLKTGSASIGKPLANMQVYVLDGEMQPVPVGVSGELYIGGAGVGRGYWKRAELTADMFVPHPFSKVGGERLYRTGDRARWRSDGELDFLGRLDEQVKLRGHRIEPGEIEAVLREVPGVQGCVVVVREVKPGDRQLVAYVVAETAAVEQWRAALKAKLPDYMIPAHFVLLGSLPLTAGGKVDRKALPAPDTDSAATSDEELVAASTAVEEVVAGIFAEVLHREQVSVTADFFELGGHSLLATQVISRVNSAFTVELAIRSLFERTTVRGIAEAIEELRKAGLRSEVPALTASPRGEALPLSYAQQRLWFLEQLTPGNLAYNIPAAARLKGNLDVAALDQSLAEVVRRHEALRTTFPIRNGEPRQVIESVSRVRLALVDLSALSESKREAKAGRLAKEQMREVFNLTTGPLLRARLLRLGAMDHVLLLTMHHIISDGWSAGVLLQEVTSLYGAFTRGQASPLAELSVQYADYAIWQRGWLQGEVLEHQLSYWREQLRDAPELELPTDYARPAVQSFRGRHHRLHLELPLLQSLKELSRREGVTLFMTLLAAFQVLLSRYSGQEDVVVGTPIAGRNRGGTEGLIGFFLNTLALRTDLSGEPGFREVLRRVREVTLAAYEHQDVPFEKLVEELRPERDLGRQPLFQVMLIFQNVPPRRLSLPGLEVQSLEQGDEAAPFDLILTLAERETGLEGELNYSTELFREESVQRLAHHYEQLLAAVVKDSEQSVRRLEMMDEGERRQVLEEWNATGAWYPAERLEELFEQQVERTPEGVALIDKEKEVSYGELNRGANRLGHYLQRCGVGAGALVGVCLERGEELVEAVLGILKAGGAYVPLDPAYPAERLRWMLGEAGVAAVVTSEEMLQRLGLKESERGGDEAGDGGVETEGWRGSEVVVVALEREAAALAAESGEKVKRREEGGAGGNEVAYVIYTSGSTGQPKGVLGLHGSTVNRLAWMWQEYPFGPGEVSCQKTTLSFVDAVWELFGPLLQGVPAVVVSEGEGQDVEQLLRKLERHQVTRLVVVPSLLRSLLEADEARAAAGEQSRLRQLRYCVSSGEELSAELAEQFQERLPGCRLLNLYGSSEVAADVSCEEVKPGGRSIALGRPIWNTEIYVLDEQLQPVPVGVRGEIYVGGAGLSWGYLHQAGLTAERFIPHPYGQEAGARLYATGDLGRYLEDGRIEYQGRRDRQVKVRGRRIELGEVEVALSRHPGVREAAVSVSRAGAGGEQLVAYVVPADVVPAAELGRSAEGEESEGAGAAALEFSLFYFAASEPKTDKYRLYLEGARYADEHGFEAIWTPERHFTEVAGLYPAPALLNAALAQVTRRIGLRAGSVVLPLNHPVRVAEEWSVVDNLSGGRVGISFTSGWVPNDFVFYPEHYREKREVMYRGIREVQKLWRGEAVRARNGLGEEIEVRTLPRPVQRELPVWLTCSGDPRSFQQAGALGVNVLTALLGQSVEQAAENLGLYREARAQHGYDPESGRVTMMLHTFIGREERAVYEQVRLPLFEYLRTHTGLVEETLKSRGVKTRESGAWVEEVADYAFERYYRKASLIGTVASVRGMVERLVAMGVNEVACLIDFGVEVEETLRSLEQLQQLKEESRKWRREAAAVAAVGDSSGNGSGQLAGAGQQRQWRAYLRARLPEYMVPARYVTLRALPLLANGKIDRQELGRLEVASRAAGATAAAPARTVSEELLSGIWAEVLRLKEVGVEDNFFELGGHSLLATQVMSRVRQVFQVQVPLRELFERPTVRELSERVEQARRAKQGEGGEAGEAAAASEPLEKISSRGSDQTAGAEALPLSYAQQRLWFLEQLTPGNVAYNVPAGVRLVGQLQVRQLERSLQEVVRRHEVLRTSFPAQGGEPRQEVKSAAAAGAELQLGVIDLSGLQSEGEREELLARLAGEEARRAFDLGKGPLLRAQLLRLGTAEQVLLLTMHHIISDGWSMGILVREVATLYQAYSAGSAVAESPLAALAVQYADFALWQRQWLQGEVLERQLGYWREQLRDVQVLELPMAKRGALKVEESIGAAQQFNLSPEVSKSLKELSRREGVTLFMTLLAAFQTLLYRYSNQEDVTLGSVIANRNQTETEGLIGCFVNMLVLRTDLSGNPTFVELLTRVREVTLNAFLHQDLPFDKLIGELQPERDLTGTPLVRAVFNFRNEPVINTSLPGLTITRVDHGAGIPHFDLLLEMGETNNRVGGLLQYRTELFDAGIINKILSHFEVLLAGIADNPARPLLDLPLLPAEAVSPAQVVPLTEAGYRNDQFIFETN